jgi:pyridoxine/pyridoxamine 5'-phosphate oxidase
MHRFETLDVVCRRIWDRLEEAATQPGHPFRALPFGTVAEEGLTLRTVILRQAEPDDRRLSFHTDRRSQKVAAIRAHERVAWLAWDPETREQIRLHGTASLHFDDAVADEMWAAQSPQSLDVYARTAAPGASLEAPDDGLNDAVTSEPITREDVAEGRRYFSVVRTVIDEMDWLHLHPEGHYRAQFQFNPEAEAFRGGWVVP